jgi:acetolactate synthase-1/2/3 large subunit
LIARNGTYQANHAARQADVLLALGVRFDDRTSSSWIPGYSFNIPPTKLIHVDIDPDEIARNYPVALGLMADVRTFLRQVLAELEARKAAAAIPASRQAWLAAIDGYRAEWEKFIAPGFQADTSPIHPQRAAHEIDKVLPENAILVSDIGIHHNWLIQFCHPRRPDSLIGSMGFGPMGFGVAGVLGAKLAAPDKFVVATLGDGAYMFGNPTVGHWVAAKHDLPILTVVFNNSRYGAVRNATLSMFKDGAAGEDNGRTLADLDPAPPYDELARAQGAYAERVEKPADLPDALARARDAVVDGKRQALLNVIAPY